MKTFADHVIEFNNRLAFNANLPEGVSVMNPFKENPWAFKASSAFYRKYYNDSRERRMILGINPGRFGAGLTGVPFTDPKRLVERCGINEYQGEPAHEPSSVFVYKLIERYGGEEKFYSDFYINSICPLGFTTTGKTGREINLNYYDRMDLQEAATPFMLQCLKQQIDFGISTEICFCLGTGKNAKFIAKLNAEHKFFKRIVPLEHPRYIIQYKTKEMQNYLDNFVAQLASPVR